ncbi:MAG: recombinase family protein [Leptolyngbyaceae cyanobacterium CSU_1_4]|nr:recombinase family protein [Leptolyngbyaceae cyanobacterium CSU_1_4]
MENDLKIFAYSYSDPLISAAPDASIWGWEIDRVYQDLGGRFQLQKLLQDCQQYPGAYLLVRRLAELGESVAEVGDRLAVLESLSIHLIAIEESVGSHDQPLRRSELLQVLKTVQDSQRSQRLQQGHARNRVKALPPPGKAPYGYRRGKDRYTLDRSTAPVVKEFFDHFLLYGSLRGSVRYLQKKYSKKISASTGQRWLTSPVYRGDLAYQNGEVVLDTHTAILSRDEAAQIDRLLRRNRQLSPRAASAPRSLSGLVTCGTCQSAMTISRVASRKADYLYLRPTACLRQPKCQAIAYGEVLEQTIQQICRDLPVAVVQVPSFEGIKPGISAEIEAKQGILDQIPALVTRGILDDETAALRAYKVRTEMAALQARAAQLPPENLKAIAQVVSLPQFWLDLSEAERRFYFREFLRQIRLIRTEENWNIQLVFIF